MKHVKIYKTVSLTSLCHLLFYLIKLYYFFFRTCGWIDTSSGSYKFTESSGQDGNGPLTDHNTFSSTGNYMLLSPNRGSKGYRLAMFTSPTLHNAAADCTLRFW